MDHFMDRIEKEFFGEGGFGFGFPSGIQKGFDNEGGMFGNRRNRGFFHDHDRLP